MLAAVTAANGGGGGSAVEPVTIGAYNEGQEMRLVCESGGGKPIPRVTWYNGRGEVIAGKYKKLRLVKSIVKMSLSSKACEVLYFEKWGKCLRGGGVTTRPSLSAVKIYSSGSREREPCHFLPLCLSPPLSRDKWNL